MKICIFDHNNNPYPILGYGGERMSQHLFEKLCDWNYDVTIVITDRSNYSYKNGKVIKLPPQEIEDIRFGKINFFKKYNNDFDIFQTFTSGIHQNFNFNDFYGKWVGSCWGYKEDASAPYLTFISKNQYENHVLDYSSDKRCIKSYISYSGVDTSSLFPIAANKNKIIWFAGIRFDKNTHLLPHISAQINRPIHMYGVVQDHYYFDNYVKPYLNDNLIYCGPIFGDEQKKAVFSEAELYLHTTYEFKEPFGLTIMEAQACGVPVVGFKTGSLPEIVYKKENLANTLEEYIDIINKRQYYVDIVDQVEWVHKNFSIDVVIGHHIKIYEDILNN